MNASLPLKKTSGAPVHEPTSTGTGNANTQLEPQKKKIGDACTQGMCPDCGSPLRFGSRGSENDYYWCSNDACPGFQGPYLFPLYYVMQMPDSPGVTDNDSIITELKEGHAIQTVALQCPCSGHTNRMPGLPDPKCPYCDGDGKLSYMLEEVEFL